MERYEAPRRRPMIRLGGEEYAFPAPADLDPDEVAGALSHAPALAEAMGLVGLPAWMLESVQEAWRLHFDLPTAAEARRLVYLLERYGGAIEADFARLFPGHDVGDLWRSRRWRALLNLIDHLPGASWFHEEVSGDLDHAMMILDAQEAAKASGEEPPPSGPGLSTWTAEVEMLAKVNDNLSRLIYITEAVNSDGRGKKPKKPEPTKRPDDVIARAREHRTFAERQRRHDMLVSRLLPHKAGASD